MGKSVKAAVVSSKVTNLMRTSNEKTTGLSDSTSSLNFTASECSESTNTPNSFMIEANLRESRNV
ncbi:MAG: hypothetical protein PV345_01935 [Wolbachia sp.]|nr:hypothetical protein [Wolbachia sp.]